MDALEKRICQEIKKLHLFHENEKVVLAVSGGPDSLALLHIMHSIAKPLEITLFVAHLDHAIRPNSHKDAQFVQRTAESLGIPCFCERHDVLGYARKYRLGIEEAAREVRYSFLMSVAYKTGATAIATGHTADDQAETVLMNILRGAGLSGLKGMRVRKPLALPVREKNNMPNVVKVDIVRPLLFTQRKDIEAYLARKNLSPVIDETNYDTAYFRNKIRHHLLPFLEEEYQSNLRALLSRNAETLALDWDFIQQEVNTLYEQLSVQTPTRVSFPKKELLSLHPSLQRYLLIHACQSLQPLLKGLSWIHVIDALSVISRGTTGLKINLPDNLILYCDYQHIHVILATNRASMRMEFFPQVDKNTLMRLDINTTYTFDRWSISISLISIDDLEISPFENKSKWQAFLDADKIHFPLYVRTRKQNDKFHPLGMQSEVKLSGFLSSQKVKQSVRDTLPLIADSNDDILWVPGVRISQKAAISEDSSNIVHVKITHAH